MEGATIRPMTPGILLVPRPSHAVFFSTSRSQRGLLWPSNSTSCPSHSLSPRLFPFLHIFHHEHNHRYGCRRKRKFLTLADKAPIGRSTCRPFWNHLRYSRPLPLYRKQSGLPSISRNYIPTLFPSLGLCTCCSFGPICLFLSWLPVNQR